jgi:SpoVK/Ycf46/Vps4 family AAA+-type ATPase
MSTFYPSFDINFLRFETLLMDSANMLREKAMNLLQTTPLPPPPPSSLIISNAKLFLSSHKQQIANVISKLLGITVSAAISYLFYKWLMDNMDPTVKDKKLAKAKSEIILKELGLQNSNLNEYEQVIATNMILPQNIDCSWIDIGGLDHLINDLRETVIYPLKNNTSKYTRSRLVQPPKGVLLFGPPGNAKTMIAKALAKESGANFINLQISSLFDKWYGESQKRTDAIFSLAQKIQPCIIFIDEIG